MSKQSKGLFSNTGNAEGSDGIAASQADLPMGTLDGSVAPASPLAASEDGAADVPITVGISTTGDSVSDPAAEIGIGTPGVELPSPGEAPVVEDSSSGGADSSGPGTPSGVAETGSSGLGAAMWVEELAVADDNDEATNQKGGGASFDPRAANTPGSPGTLLTLGTNPDGSHFFTGNRNVDATLIGSKWSSLNLTYSFPTSGSNYNGATFDSNGVSNYHLTLGSQQQASALAAFAQLSALTGLTFTEITDTDSVHANIRISQTADADVPSAYGNFASDTKAMAGDIWFGKNNQPYYDLTGKGTWGYATMMHEIGHTMGLKHGHQDYTNSDLSGFLGSSPRFGSQSLTADRDGQAWSLMTYTPAPFTNSNFAGEKVNQPQTYMQYDVAALQYLYGANFSTNSGDTVYTFSQTTGEMFVNGVGQGAPVGNKIFLTIWDGGGNDTIDASNYANGVTIDLRPGEFSTVDQNQLVNNLAYQNLVNLAPGNFAMSLLYNNDSRSLVENATGGTGNDIFVGNTANNVLDGGAGSDSVIFTNPTGVNVTLNDLATDVIVNHDGETDTLRSIENIGGTSGNDTITGNSLDNVLTGGSGGTDVLSGNDGNDRLVGGGFTVVTSFVPGSPPSQPDITKPGATNNNSIANALNTAGAYDIDANANITNSTTIPHATINATSGAAIEYYRIDVTGAGAQAIFDIDGTGSLTDSIIELVDSAGNLLATNDTGPGDPGTTVNDDAYISHTFAAAGTYYIRVGRFTSATGSVAQPMLAGTTYTLHISLQGAVGATVFTPSNTSSLVADGGEGNDVLVGTLVDDTLSGGNGNDTASFVNAFSGGATTGVTVDLNLQGAAQNTVSAGNDTLTGFENLVGSSLNDTLTGDGSDNFIEGGLGNDTLAGGLGNDTASYAGAAAGVTVSLALQGAGQGTVNAGTDTLSGFENLAGSAFNDSLTGDSSTNTLSGGAGNDTLNPGANAGLTVDLLDGGLGTDTASFAGNASAVTATLNGVADGTATVAGLAIATLRSIENLTGSANADILTGDANANAIEGGLGDDILDGGLGVDTLVFSGATGVTVNLALATATGLGSDSIANFENVRTGSGADNITGDGLDNIFFDGGGNDTYNGAGGIDTIDYSAATSGIGVNLATLTAQNTTGGGTDTITNIENIIGSATAGNVLQGDAAANRFTGGAAADTILGNLGSDTIFGGAGNDILIGGTNGGTDDATADTVEGGLGSDYLAGGQGNDILRGGDGDDTLVGGIGRNDLAFFANDGGDDVYEGGEGTDIAIATYDGRLGVGASTVGISYDIGNIAGNSNITWNGVVVGSMSSIERTTFRGSNVNDVVKGGGSLDSLTGLAGDDTLDGWLGNDILDGGLGNDTLIGGEGLDTATYATATAGVTIDLRIVGAQATGGSGSDTLIGIEYLAGSAFGDTLRGNDSFNLITDSGVSAAGQTDSIFGYGGNDSILVTRAAASLASNINMDGGDGDDFIELRGGTLSAALAVNAAGLIAASNGASQTYMALGATSNDRNLDVVTVDGGAGNDRIVLSGVASATINAGSGNDTVSISMRGVTSVNNYQLTLGSGADIVQLGGTSAEVATTARTNRVTDFDRGDSGDKFEWTAYLNGGLTGYTANSNAFASGHLRLTQSGSDLLVQIDRDAGGATNGFVTIFAISNGYTGAFTAFNFDGFIGNLTLTGIGALDETITGATGNDTLSGGDGNDVLIGLAGNDTLDGGNNDDVLRGGAGNDTLIGGAGTDTASYSDATAGVTVDLSLAGAQNTVGAGSDTLSGIENLTGSDFADGLTGDGNANRIDAGAGNDTVDGAGGNDTLDGGAGDDTLKGGIGDDSLYGGAGNDSLIGGTGTDTANYDGVRSHYTVTAIITNGVVTGYTVTDNFPLVAAAAVDEGSDTLTGMESITFSDMSMSLGGSVLLYDGSNNLVGAYSTIQAAIDASSNGYTVWASAGSYTENLNVNKDITITGPNAGIAGNGARGAETVVDGLVSILADGVTLNGLKITGAPLYGQDITGIFVNNDNATLTNLVLDGPNNGYGIQTTYNGGVTGLVLSNSLVTEWGAGTYFNPTTQFTATGNSFTGNGNDLLGDGWAAGSFIDNNSFNNSVGSHIGYGTYLSFEDMREIVGENNVFTGTGSRAVGIFAYGDGTPGGQDVIGTEYADGFFGSEFVGGSGMDSTFHGLGGNDSMYGAAGNDSFDGGSGTDTSSYDGVATIAETVTGWTVTTGTEGTDTLENVEIVDDGNGGVIRLVGHGGYATIQDAINASNNGDTIVVASGTWNEDLNVNKDVTIQGVNNHGIAGTAGRGAESVINGQINVSAAGATIDGFKLVGPSTGSLEDPVVQIDGNNFSLVNNLIDGSGSLAVMVGLVGGVDIGSNLLKGYDIGIYVAGGGTTGSIHNNRFQGDVGPGLTGMGNGVNSESSHVTIVNNAFDEIYYGSLNLYPYGPDSVDLNAYISGNTITNSGVARPVQIMPTDLTHNFIGTDFNEAFDGETAAANGVSGAFSYDGRGGDDRAWGGEEGDTLSGGTGADQLFGNGGADTLNGGDNNDIVQGGSGNDTITGGSGVDTLSGGDDDDTIDGGSGNDTLNGENGNDTLHGGGGNDALNGGAGTDTAVYDGTRGDYSVTMTTNSSGRVIAFTIVSDNEPSNGNEGQDSLNSIERLQFTGRTLDLTQPVQLFDQNNQLLGTFSTIQAAIDGAQDNYTIRVAAGTFDEDLTINVGVRILGARTSAVTGRDSSGGVGETTIIGHHKITADDNVTLTGLRFLNDGTTTGGGASDPTLQILTGGGAAGHLVSNSIFWSTVTGGANGDRAISAPSIADGQLTLNGNLISGSQQGLFGTASWDRGLWMDGGGVTLSASGNIIEWTRTGLSLDGAGGTIYIVNGNTLRNLGTAFSIGTTEDGFAPSSNNFTNVGDEYNFRNLAEDVVFDAGAVGGTVTPVGGPNDVVVILSGSGNDTINGTSGADYIDGNNRPGNLTVADSDTLTGGGGNDTIFGRYGNDNLDGGAGSDTVDGGEGDDNVDGGADNDVLLGGGGTDLLNGGGGDDNIDGGAGTDTAVVGGGAIFTPNGTSWTVVSSDGTDTLVNVEIVDDSIGGNTLLVGSGGFTTIQAAVDAANDGDTILVAAGTYIEQVVVDGLNDLTIQSIGGTVTIQAPADLHETARSSSDREVHGVLTVLNGTNIVIDNIDINGNGAGNTVDEGGGAGQANFYGIFYRNASGTLLGVDITGVRDPYPGGTAAGGEPLVSGVQRGVGLVVDNDSLLDFTMTGGSITDFQKNGTAFNRANLNVTGVTITGGGAQTGNAQNGLQVANSTGTISGNTITGIGYAGAANAYSGGILGFGNTNLNITNNVITGSNDDSTASKVVGIYIFSPAANSGGSISGNTISYVDTGIGVYDDVTPNGILIENNGVTNIDLTDPYAAGVDFEPNPAFATPYDVDGTDGDDILLGGAGNDTFAGLGGNDFLQGNGGNDNLAGDGGTDTAAYSGVRAGYNIVVVTDGDGRVIGYSSVTDTNAGNGDDGADTLTSIEKLQFADGTLDLAAPVQLFDASNALVGTFNTIQAAIDAASDDYTIRVAAGTYDEDLTIDVGVAILGAHAGDAVGGRDAAGGTGETTIIGHALVTATDNVTVDGIRFLNDATTSGGGKAIHFTTGGGATGHLVTNSIFWATLAGGANGVDDRAISTQVIADGLITITDNLISGTSHGQFGTASWGRGIWFDGGGVDLVATGNTIEWTRSGLNLDMSGDSTANVSNNTLNNLGTFIAVGVDADGLTVSNNDVMNVGDDFSFRNLTTGVTFDAEAAIDALTPVGNGNDLVVVLGGSGNDNITGTSGADYIDGNNSPSNPGASDSDTLSGAGGADIIFGRGGNDSLEGGSGNDSLDGGSGTDTAVYSGPATINNTGTSWTVTDAGGTDTLVSIEIVNDSAAGRTLLVGDGAFATIQAAVNAAQDGDTILISAGTYIEQVVVNGLDDLTFTSIGGQVTIQAPADLVETARSSSDREVHGVLTVLNGTNIVIDNIDINGNGAGNTVDEGGGAGQANFYGIFYRNASGTLLGVDITGVRDPYPGGTAAGGEPLVSGVQRGVGLVVDNDSLLDFTMTGGSITDFQKNGTSFNRANLNVTGVTITGGGAQTGNAQNGLQVANSTGTISGNTITGIGYAGAANAYSGGILGFGNTNLNITNNVITGSNDDSTASKVVGIFILSPGANSGGSISGNTVSYVDTGIGVYGDVTPNGILIENNGITNIDSTDPYAAGVDFEPNPAFATPYDVDGSAGDDILLGGAGGDTLAGLGGNDFLQGNGGNDNLSGGGDTDTAAYSGARSGYTVGVTTDSHGRVTGFTSVTDTDAGNGNDGADTLTGIEKLQFGNVTLDLAAPVQLFDAGNNLVGTFATIQAAVDAASDDYVIRVPAGTYDEDLTIDVGVTILGAQAGVAVSGRDALAGTGETTIIGHAHVTAVDNVTLDGLRFLNDGTTTGGGSANPTLMFQTGGGAAGHSVTDSIFWSTLAGGANGVDDRAISTQVLADGLISITDNLISGSSQGQFGTASWGRGIWFDGGGVDLVVTGNSIQWSRTGLNIDMSGDSTADISDNAFRGLGSGISVGVDTVGLTVADNDHQQVGSDFNFRNLTSGVTFDAGDAIDTLTPSDATNDLVAVLGGSGNDTLTGTDGADVIDGNNGPNAAATDTDTLDGAGGNDQMFGRAGTDSLKGGTGNDSLDGGDGFDTAVYSGNAVDYTITYVFDGGGNVVGYSSVVDNKASDGDDGSDTLVSIEHLVFADGPFIPNTTVHLYDENDVLVANFVTIQAAINAASDDYTIRVDAGTYDEDLTIDVGVTILGAESGNAVGGRDAAGGTGETTIVGHAHVTATDNVTLDGLRFLNDGTTTGGGSANPTLMFQTGGGATGHSVTNSIFWSTLAGGAGGVDDRAISTQVLADGLISITDNLISGTSHGQFGTASWGRGIWFDGGGVDLVVTGNTIEWSRTGLNLDMSGDSTANVSDNVFRGLGTGMALGVDAVGLTVSSNDIERVNEEFSFRNLSTDVTFDAGAAIGTLTLVGDFNDPIVVLGGSGNDNFTGTAGVDVLDGNNSGTNPGAADTDTLSGLGGNDFLFGRGGNDVLDGGTGDDAMTGGTGNDVYVVDSASDTVTEAASEGIDELRTALASYSLAALANVENLTGLGNVNQTLTGNDANNVIDGGLGIDAMTGGLGNDTYVVDNAGDTVTENASEGTDEVRTSLATYSLASLTNLENLTGTNAAGQTLTGNGGANVITAAAGNDIIDGGLGADTMIGGAGNDFYTIDNAGDLVTELAGGGTADEVQTGLAVYVLAANVEKLTATTAGNHDFRGNASDNIITTLGGNDFVRIQDGGIDSVSTGAGTDVVYVGGAFNTFDFIDGGSGSDTIVMQGDYSGGITFGTGLVSNIVGIEGISLVAGSSTLFGDSADNRYDYVFTMLDSNVAAGLQFRINGGNLLEGEDLTVDGSAETDGSFLIFGGKGADVLTGGANSDVFFFAHDGRLGAGDHIDGGAGVDGLFIRGNFTVDFNDPDYFDLIRNVENITLTSVSDIRYARSNDLGFDYDIITDDGMAVAGSTLTINGGQLQTNETMKVDGHFESNAILRIFGGFAGDTITGGAMGDTLYGGVGADTLKGNGGNDVFLYFSHLESISGARDHILDLTSGDKIDLTRVDAMSGFTTNDAFSFIGSGAFTGVQGELRAENTGGNDWLIQGDRNGDGVADMEILVTTGDSHIIGATDFFL